MGPQSNGILVSFELFLGIKLVIFQVFVYQYLKKNYLLKNKLFFVNFIPILINTNDIFTIRSFAEGYRETQTKLAIVTSVHLVLLKKACYHRYTSHWAYSIGTFC